MNNNEFKVKIMDFNEQGEFVITGEKMLYNLDNEVAASDWVREEVRGVKTYDAPQISSGCKVKQSGRGRLVKDALGYIQCGGNNVYQNDIMVSLVSGTFSNAHGLSVIPQNFMKVVSLFAARRLITGKYHTWINDNDEYMKPNTDHSEYKQWNNDCVIYSLFNTASNQSSLRDVKYKGKTWQIFNEFFWLDYRDVKDFADHQNNDLVYKDAKRYGKQRHVATLLKSITLSDDAKAVLAAATELWRFTFNYREIMDEEHPEYHLNTWDCGWYQIKKLAKQHFPDTLKEFTVLYSEFSNRLRPLVYELGFLK